jgi:carbon monoxide dehydrogenase subunit G
LPRIKTPFPVKVPSDVLFKAVVKVARTHHVINSVDQNERRFTFHTEATGFAGIFDCTGLVEAEGADESTRVLHIEMCAGVDLGRTNGVATKFFNYVQEELQQEKTAH